MIELSHGNTETNTSFTDSQQITMGDNTWNAGKDSVTLTIYSSTFQIRIYHS